MEKKDSVASPSSHVAQTAPLTPEQTAALRAGQAPQQTADGAFSVGDRVTIEAIVMGISGNYLTLAVERAPITEGRAADPTDGGTTLTLGSRQVKKA